MSDSPVPVNGLLTYLITYAGAPGLYFDRGGNLVSNLRDVASRMDRATAEALVKTWGEGWSAQLSPMHPALSPALSYLKQFRQFIVWRAVPDPGKKPRKVPVDYRTGTVGVNPHDSAYWTDYDSAAIAAAAWGSEYSVGFVLTREARVAVIDYDNALLPDGTWHPTVGAIHSKIPGAAIEISHSSTGAHNWCIYQGELPAQDITTVNIGGLKVELFLAKKFIALGNQETAQGNAGTDYTDPLVALAAQYFQPSKGVSAGDAEWSEGHELGWELPDDAELIRIAMKFEDHKAAFGNKASFLDLWNRNVLKLSIAYPSDTADFGESEADLALAGKLAWLTGNDCPRIERLMRQSSLLRDKWDSHSTYLCEFTIPKALKQDGDFWDPKYKERQATAAAAGAPPRSYLPEGMIAEMAAIVASTTDKSEAAMLMMQLGTQDSIAGAFATLYAGKLKFDHSRKRWHIWDGTRWRADDKKRAFDLVVSLCREKNREGKSSMGSSSFAHGVEELSSSRAGISVSGSEWDRENYLLNTPAGTVDLRTGLTREPNPEDMITKCTAASPSTVGDGASFRKFLMEITEGDEELIGFHQVSLGAILSGAVEDHWMLFWTGVGRNGKNTLGELVQDVMGDYAKKIGASTLMSKKFQGHSEEIADLHGFRLAISSELNDGDHWDEARINEVTGDATLSARHMYGSRFTFQRTQKHLVYANYKPQLRSVSAGIRSRIKIVPFKVSFVGREDADLPGRLRGEMGFVLQWLIEGHRRWLAAGKKLPRCTAVEAETADYFDNQSTPQLWLKERCEVRDDLVDLQLHTVMELYGDYKNWAIARGELPLSKKRWEGQAIQPAQKVDTRRGACIRRLRLRLPFGGSPLPPGAIQ